jgi:hypothetical protein
VAFLVAARLEAKPDDGEETPVGVATWLRSLLKANQSRYYLVPRTSDDPKVQCAKEKKRSRAMFCDVVTLVNVAAGDHHATLVLEFQEVDDDGLLGEPDKRPGGNPLCMRPILGVQWRQCRCDQQKLLTNAFNDHLTVKHQEARP